MLKNEIADRELTLDEDPLEYRDRKANLQCVRSFSQSSI
jgi:hypothetical protein